MGIDGVAVRASNVVRVLILGGREKGIYFSDNIYWSKKIMI